jgi:hypothetical protein
MMNTLSPCADHDAKWIEKVHSVHCYLVLLEFLPCTLRMSRLCKTSVRNHRSKKSTALLRVSKAIAVLRQTGRAQSREILEGVIPQ